ncbi:heparinase II/III family protein [Alphaproteobacteria bacterium]|nr:heparinase II/III family protein [Alphaproteobacteria bacterium]
MVFLSHYSKWINKFMLNSLNWITNNYFLKQKLKVPEFNAPVRKLTDSWQGIPKKGHKILNGALSKKGSLDFNKFEFLRDLKSEGSIKARTTTRSLVESWIDEDYNLLSKEFRTNAIVSRITSWCFNYSWFAESGRLNFQKKLLKSIALQTKYLELKLIDSKNHLEKIIIIKGIIVGQAILYQETIEIKRFLNLLEDELYFLINHDGGHKTRSPILQIELLRHLVEIRSVVAILKNIDATNLHMKTIKMGEFCRSFQMPNGFFSWFHGGSLVSKDMIKQTLDRIGYKNKVFNIAEDTGFCRMSSMDSLVFIDIGSKRNTSNDKKASLFAFEFFYKKQKLISNLGELINSNLLHAKNSLASSAAHSTLNIDDRNNIDLSGNRKTKVFNIKYNKIENGHLLDVIHSGYEEIYGVNHRRQIFLSQKKSELRGRDEVINIDNIGVIPKSAIIRFHIYPEIDLIRTRSGSILLNHKKGFTWKFSVRNQSISTQDSVMFTSKGPLECKQIIINIKLDKIRAYKLISCDWAFELQK